jgi:hypothetical protein
VSALIRVVVGLGRAAAGGAIALLLLASLTGCLKAQTDKPNVKPSAAARKAAKRTAAPVEAAKEPEKETVPEEVKLLARKRRDELVAQAQKFDRQALTRQLVLEKYQFDIDTLFPDGIFNLDRLKSEGDVKGQVFKRAFAAADQEYPVGLRQRVADQAAKNVPLYQLGDIVETVSTNRDLVQKGKLEVVYADYIVVGGHKILIGDLKSPSPDYFDPAIVERRREQFVRVNYENPRAEFLRKKQAELTPEVYRECGFLRVNGKWVSLKTLIPKEIDPVVDKEEEDYNQRLKRRLEQVVIREFRRQGIIPAKGNGAKHAEPETEPAAEAERAAD